MSPAALHPCARCAQLQRTCCQRAEIVLTIGDVERITMATGRTDFWERRVPENDVYRQADPNDPNWRRWTTDEEGRRRQLRRHPDGDCFFLGSHGCTLDLESRPLVCRLYPFAYDERGVHGIDDAYCPVEALVGRDVPGATMLTVLGMVPADGRRWHRMLYDELRQEHDRCASA